MKANPNWKYHAKQHEICLARLSDPYDIVELFKMHRIEKFLYRITYKGIVLKFGMSCPKSLSAIPGDRVYRQIGHACSWGTKRLTGSSGADWRIIEEDFEKLYGFKPDHRDMTVTVWDVSNYPFETLNPFDEVNAIENSLIEEYVNIVGQKPIGNINDEANIKRKSGISKKLAEALFVFN
jgi:hypothetical protein